jgi:hypothetical protein
MLSSRTSRTAFLLCASALASLGLASGASAANPKLSITQFTAPNGTAIQDSTMLQMGTLRNSGAQAGNAVVDVTIDGNKVARLTKRVKAHSSKSFDVDVPVGADLATGTHQLDACLRRNAAAGSECAGASQLKVAAKDKAPEAEPAPPPAVCTSGARTLGDRNFPEQGNGGYDAQNYDIFFNYNTATNSLLADPSNPTHVTMTAKATQDLCDFALDFSIPASLIDSVKVNGVAAPFSKQAPPGGAPTCPVTNVSNTCHGSAASAIVYPPPNGCSPSVNNPPNPLVTGVTELHNQCPAMKLVIDPAADIANGSTFTVDVAYHGTPGVHWDPDGSVEGWAPTFTNVPSPGTPDGAYVVNEPIGAYEWMPVNNHPQDKATYDFRLTVPQGKTALGNGELVYYTDNPDTTRTWRWEMNYPMESAMATTTSGTFDLTGTVANNGIQYYDAFDSTFTAAQKNTANVQVNQHPAITEYLTNRFGRYPFDSGGVVADNTSGSQINYVLEVQSKIHFPSSTVSLGTLVHETTHMWFGDAVSPNQWNHIWFNEGWATYGSYDYTAFQLNGTSLQSQFNTNYTNAGGTACPGGTNKWCIAPLDVDAQNEFTTFPTYTRHATMLIALRQILGPTKFYNVARHAQGKFAGSNITFQQYKDVILNEAGDKCTGPGGTPGPSGFTTTELGKLNIFLNQWLAGTDITGTPAFGPPSNLAAPNITGANFFPVDPSTPPVACPAA